MTVEIDIADAGAGKAQEQPVAGDAPDRSADIVRRRRRWLYAFTLLGFMAILAVAGVRLIDETGDGREHAGGAAQRSLVLERFELIPPARGRARGLVELVRRGDATSIRMIAVRLKQSIADEVYQVVLTRRRGADKVLGGRPVGAQGTFIARADVSAEELHRYRAIEMRRVGSVDDGRGRLVLRAVIPR